MLEKEIQKLFPWNQGREAVERFKKNLIEPLKLVFSKTDWPFTIEADSCDEKVEFVLVQPQSHEKSLWKVGSQYSYFHEYER